MSRAFLVDPSHLSAIGTRHEWVTVEAAWRGLLPARIPTRGWDETPVKALNSELEGKNDWLPLGGRTSRRRPKAEALNRRVGFGSATSTVIATGSMAGS